MRIRIIIVLMLAVLGLNAQYRVTYDGKYLVANGKYITATAANLPQSPQGTPSQGTPPTESISTYYINDFSRVPGNEYTQTNIEADFTSNGFADCTDNISIEIFSGDTVLKNFYQLGHCGNCGSSCTGCTCDYGGGTGVGANFGYFFESDYSGHDTVILSYNYYMSSDFEIGQDGEVEMKLPGMRADGGTQTNSAVIRPRLYTNWTAGYHRYLTWYAQREGESNETFYPLIGTVDDTISVGEWHNISILLAINTGGSANGLAAFYLDETLVGFVDTLTYTTSGNQWDRVEYSTFIGGCGDESWGWKLTPLQDQEIYIDDMIIWKPDDLSGIPSTITLPSVVLGGKY